jgi:hypothetical protein
VRVGGVEHSLCVNEILELHTWHDTAINFKPFTHFVWNVFCSTLPQIMNMATVWIFGDKFKILEITCSSRWK